MLLLVLCGVVGYDRGFLICIFLTLVLCSINTQMHSAHVPFVRMSFFFRFTQHDGPGGKLPLGRYFLVLLFVQFFGNVGVYLGMTVNR